MKGNARAVGVVIAGGGTGGHVFPGLAIAEEFRRRNENNRILFVGTRRGFERTAVPDAGFGIAYIDVEAIKGKGIMRALTSAAKIPRSMVQSRAILGSFRPDMVIGVGGYASGPAVLTALLMDVRTAIAEQNAQPGLTNKILGKMTDLRFLSFSETKRFFPGKESLVTGNPVRSGFLSLTIGKRGERRPFNLLIFGGSQGASSINHAVMEFLEHAGPLLDELHIVHQTGKADFEVLQEVYRERSIDAEVLPFITDMAGAYQWADLLICRAGATSLAEITASGKAAILVPYPFAAGDHQTRNAEILAAAGAARMVTERELSGSRLMREVETLMRNSKELETMEEQAASLGNRNAAVDIVDASMTLMGQGRV